MEENRQNPEEINEEVTETEEESKKTTNVGREILEWIICIVAAVAIALFLRNFVVTFARVDGPSMNQTLNHNDSLIVLRLGYQPEAGDVIIFNPENGSAAPYIKRIIATEGQKVELIRTVNGVEVYVDGELKDEPYAYASEPDYYIGDGVYEVPEDHVFVMGDNRCNSHDSRSADVGCVAESQIMGEAVVRVWPLSKMGKF